MNSVLLTIIQYLETFINSEKLSANQRDRVSLCKTILTNVSMELADQK